MDLTARVAAHFAESIAAKQQCQDLLAADVAAAAELMVAALVGDGKILACGVSATVGVTGDFVSSMFVGRSLLDDPDSIKRMLESRYFGSSQKALLVAFKDAQKKYNQVLAGQPVDLSD